MSVLTWVRTNARVLAKGSLYVAGAAAIGYPLIKGAQKALNGESLDAITDTILYEATGYSTGTGDVNRGKLGEVIVRDLVGGGSIYVAGKL